MKQLFDGTVEREFEAYAEYAGFTPERMPTKDNRLFFVLGFRYGTEVTMYKEINFQLKFMRLADNLAPELLVATMEEIAEARAWFKHGHYSAIGKSWHQTESEWPWYAIEVMAQDVVTGNTLREVTDACNKITRVLGLGSLKDPVNRTRLINIVQAQARYVRNKQAKAIAAYDRIYCEESNDGRNT